MKRKPTRCGFVEYEHVWTCDKLETDANSPRLSTTDPAGMRCPSSDARIPHVGEAKLLEHILDSLTLLRIGDVFGQAQSRSKEQRFAHGEHDW